MAQTLYKFFFLILLVVCPQEVGAEMSRSIVGNENHIERSGQAEIQHTKKGKRHGFRWKKINAGKLVGTIILFLLLLAVVGLIAVSVSLGGEVTLGGILIAIFILFLLIMVLKGKRKKKSIDLR